MSQWNKVALRLPAKDRTLRVALSHRGFGLLSASRPFVIHCISGGVWITQEATRNDIVLGAGERCRAAASQKVFLNALQGALLAISLDDAGARPRPVELRVEITRGAYALSGGAEYGAGMRGEARRGMTPHVAAAKQRWQGPSR